MKIKALISVAVATTIAASAMALSASAASFTKTADVGVSHFDMGHVSGTSSFSKTHFSNGTTLKIDYSDLFTKLNDEATLAGAKDKSGRTLKLANVTVNGAPVNGTDAKNFTTAVNGTLTFGLSSDSGNIASGNYTAFTFGASAVITEGSASNTVDKDATQKLADYLKEEGTNYSHLVSITASAGNIFDANDNVGTSEGAFANINGGKVSIATIKFDGLQTGDADANTNNVASFDFRSGVSDNLKFTTAEKAVLRKVKSVVLDLGIRGAGTTGSIVKIATVDKDNYNSTPLTNGWPTSEGAEGVEVVQYAAVPKGATSLSIPIDITKLYDEKYGDIFDGVLLVTIERASGSPAKLTSAKIVVEDVAGGSLDVSEKSESEALSESASETTTTTVATTTEVAAAPEDDEPVAVDPEEEGTGFEEDDTNGGNTNEPGESGGDVAGGSSAANPKTGVALAILPALVAGAAVVVSRKKK